MDRELVNTEQDCFGTDFQNKAPFNLALSLGLD